MVLFIYFLSFSELHICWNRLSRGLCCGSFRNGLRRSLAELDVGAHSLNLRGLLFELHAQSFDFRLLPRGIGLFICRARLELSNRFFLFLVLAVLFEKL